MHIDIKHAEEILVSLQRFDYRSWDHYDFWGSSAGVYLRKNRNLLTMPVIGAAYILDVLLPKIFRSNIKQDTSMETLPSLMKAMLIYKEITGDERFEADRARLLSEMVSRLGRSTNGRGVGHQFDWYTTRLLKAYTPCVTLSWYFVDYIFYASLSELPEYREILRDIGEFVFRDLGRKDMEDGTSKIGYTEFDKRYVVNANSYGSLILHKTGKLFGRKDYLELAERLNRFVLAQQNDDGGWLYFEKGSVPDEENFIDCFHTAFVIENLMAYSAENDDADTHRAFQKGLDYFIRTFVRDDGSVKPFAKSHLPLEPVIDTRSAAEAANLLSLAGIRNAELLPVAEKILGRLKETMFCESGGYYYHRRYSFALSRMNYIRWGSAPVVAALVNLSHAKLKRKGG